MIGLFSVLLSSLLLITNASAHGVTTEAIVILFLPALLGVLFLIIASIRLMMEKPVKKWFLAALAVFICQALWLLFLWSSAPKLAVTA